MMRQTTANQLSLLDLPGVGWSDSSGLRVRIRESKRARRLILQVLPNGVLEVIVPRGTRARDVSEFVTSNRRWIDDASRRLGRDDGDATGLPDRIALAATGECWDVDYCQGRGRVQLIADRRLEVTHDVGDDEGACRLLRRWLLGRGRDVLIPWLRREAARLAVEPGAVQVRLQRTRWGSCSSRGSISLNAALLLVEPDLVRYLLVHELCHLSHLNHSRRYWARVRRFEPDFETLDRGLALEWRRLPGWLFAQG